MAKKTKIGVSTLNELCVTYVRYVETAMRAV